MSEISLLRNGAVFRVLGLTLRQVFTNFATKLLPAQYPVTLKVSTEVLELLPYPLQKKRLKWPRQLQGTFTPVRRIWFRTERRILSASSNALYQPRKVFSLREIFEIERLLNGAVSQVWHSANLTRISQKNSYRSGDHMLSCVNLLVSSKARVAPEKLSAGSSNGHLWSERKVDCKSRSCWWKFTLWYFGQDTSSCLSSQVLYFVF
jgi:hypothetical protein